MPFVAGLYEFLAGTAGITALTGEGDDARIYPAYAPTPEMNATLEPTLIFYQVARQDIELLASTAKQKRIIEFVGMAATHAESHALADALETALHRYVGAMGDYTCHFAKLLEAEEAIEATLAEQGIYAVISRYSIIHSS